MALSPDHTQLIHANYQLQSTSALHKQRTQAGRTVSCLLPYNVRPIMRPDVMAIKFAFYILMFIGLFVNNVLLLSLIFCDNDNYNRTLVYRIICCFSLRYILGIGYSFIFCFSSSYCVFIFL